MTISSNNLRVTDRRSFLRVIGGVGLTSAIAPGYLLAQSEKAYARGILIEASSFDTFGGRKLDTHHYQQMGVAYLQPHGMVEPVANAKTEVEVESGQWHVWVRNRDWCPGEWKSPGRFQLLIENEPLKKTFGSGSDQWHWEYGGSLKFNTNKKIAIELQDITGFDGRCDAIFLTQDQEPNLPNKNLIDLANWKDLQSGRVNLEIQESEFDLVIVGGGMAGCGAALAARSRGLKVALIQDRPFFGGNASEEVRVHTLGIHGYATDIIKQIDTAHYPNGNSQAIEDQSKREANLAAAGVDLFAGHIACGLQKQGDSLVSVEAKNVLTGLIHRFKASTFIDSTGDGWLGYWAGAEFRSGREASSEFGEQWDKHGDLWSPLESDNRVMGTSVLWGASMTDERHVFPDVPWAMPVALNHEAIQGDWQWEYSAPHLDQISDAEQIRDHLLRAIYGSFSNAKQMPKYASWRLDWVAYIGGKRESRRIMGDYIYTMHDATERREFPDAVVVERREIDSHYQRAEKGDQLDFLSQALFHKTGGDYYIPFRSLYSKDIVNLMMAGRCFSCSHIGLAGPRVMNTCAQMGVATGFAAVLCKKHRTNPRIVGNSHIQELRELIGFGQNQLTPNPAIRIKAKGSQT